MKQCGDNRFCCLVNNSTGCDCASTSLFELDAATFVTTLPLSTMLSTSTALPASASATATSASQSTSTPASSSPTEQSSSQSSNHSVAIGAGIGAGVGIPLLVAVGVFAWYLHRRQKSREAAMTREQAHPIQEVKGSTKVEYELMGSVNEMQAGRPHEMDAINASHEIDGSAKYRRDV